jgi:hypothetical protein
VIPLSVSEDKAADWKRTNSNDLSLLYSVNPVVEIV